MAAFPVLVTLEMLSGAQIGSTPGVHPGEAAFAGFLVEVAQVQAGFLEVAQVQAGFLHGFAHHTVLYGL